MKFNELITYVIPFQIYIKHLMKHCSPLPHETDFILYDRRYEDKYIYEHVLSGRLYEIEGFESQEFLFQDCVETKKCKIKKLEKELSKLKGGDN